MEPMLLALVVLAFAAGLLFGAALWRDRQPRRAEQAEVRARLHADE